jgi:aspartate ammonia-lyase
MNTETRTEHDLLGERQVPLHADWGIHTLRAVENFPISGRTLGDYPPLVRALALVKQACAGANRELGTLDPGRADDIAAACAEVAAGGGLDQFVVDMIQGGAGTSTNMNANEVIANRALVRRGLDRGSYQVIHPLEHVNLSQSTNDVYPTAVKLALQFEITGLAEAMTHLKAAFEAKAAEFAPVLKMGRTQLQDAVPMTLGQEFSTYAVMLGEDLERLTEARGLIREINLGATAIGTGINAPAGYAAAARRHLSSLTGIAFVTAQNLVEATQDAGAFVQLSGVLKRIAVKLSKVCNDLRLLSSGPRAGLGEINLPPVQAGSSIMPGKVNPVIPEVVNQVAFEVIGNDTAVTFAAEAGQLQLNAFEPLIAVKLLDSLAHLRQACLTLADRCVVGITANKDRLASIVENSIGIVTALNPHIGYENATMVARQAYATGKSVRQVVLDLGLLPAETLDEVLRPGALVSPT